MELKLIAQRTIPTMNKILHTYIMSIVGPAPGMMDTSGRSRRTMTDTLGRVLGEIEKSDGGTRLVNYPDLSQRHRQEAAAIIAEANEQPIKIKIKRGSGGMAPAPAAAMPSLAFSEEAMPERAAAASVQPQLPSVPEKVASGSSIQIDDDDEPFDATPPKIKSLSKALQPGMEKALSETYDSFYFYNPFSSKEELLYQREDVEKWINRLMTDQGGSYWDKKNRAEANAYLEKVKKFIKAVGFGTRRNGEMVKVMLYSNFAKLFE